MFMLGYTGLSVKWHIHCSIQKRSTFVDLDVLHNLELFKIVNYVYLSAEVSQFEQNNCQNSTLCRKKSDQGLVQGGEANW